jgi:hypothetical protein
VTALPPSSDISGLIEIARHRQNQRMVIVSAALTVLPVVGIFTVLAIRQPSLRLSPAVVLLILAVALSGPLLGAGGVALLRRRGAAWAQPSPVFGLDRRTRRQLLRALRRGRPIPPEQREIAAHLAEQIRRARWTPLLCSAPLLLQSIYLGRDGWQGMFAKVAVAVGVLLAGWTCYIQYKIVHRPDLEAPPNAGHLL